MSDVFKSYSVIATNDVGMLPAAILQAMDTAIGLGAHHESGAQVWVNDGEGGEVLVTELRVSWGDDEA